MSSNTTGSTSDDPIVIVGQARTAMGGFMGELSSVKATTLGATAISAAVERAGRDPKTRVGSGSTVVD